MSAMHFSMKQSGQRETEAETLGRARALAGAGRVEEAMALWSALLAANRSCLPALQALAAAHDARGEYDAAAGRIESWLALAGENAAALEALAQISLKGRHIDKAIIAYGRALRARPQDPRILLQLGAAFLARGEAEPAAACASLLKSRSPDFLHLARQEKATRMFREASERLRHCLQAHDDALLGAAISYGRETAPDSRIRHAGDARWRPEPMGEAPDGRRPAKLLVPGLPDIPFRDRRDFPWVATLEARTAGLIAEVERVLDIEADGRPYIAEHLGASSVWKDLAGGTDWSAVHLYNGGRPNDAAIARFPAVMDAIRDLPLCRIGGHPVEAFLSILKPKTRIPAHYGVSNHRLTVHLPLIVPDGCGLRAGDDSRTVRSGETLIFDDSQDHEAWNDSDQPRTTLIFEIWAPELTEADRVALGTLLELHAAFEAGRDSLVACASADPAPALQDAVRRLRAERTDVRAWLMGCEALRRLGRHDEAAAVFSLADEVTPAIRTAATRQHAAPDRRFMAREGQALLARYLGDLHREAVGADGPERILSSIWVRDGLDPPAFRHDRQRPHMFYVPDLPAEPVFPRETLPFAAGLEKATDAIREEFLAAVDPEKDGDPYIPDAPASDPQWERLKGSRDWTGLHLFKDGTANERFTPRFPRTLKALAATPVTRLDGKPIEVFFSVLKPGAHIPPHYGLSNCRMTVHLPLIVPKGCSIRVASHRQEWREGEIFAFDDSFDHEVWNAGEETRVLLIFEAWHPALGPEEIAAIERCYSARARWFRNRRIPLG